MDSLGINTVWIEEEDVGSFEPPPPYGIKMESEPLKEDIFCTDGEEDSDQNASASKECQMLASMKCEMQVTEHPPPDAALANGEHFLQSISHSSPQAKPKILCPICLKLFNSKKLLKRHLSIHTGERPFVCSLCTATFRLKECLKMHMITHSDRKPYQCSHCRQFFKQKTSLKKHIRLHLNIKPYKCSLCPEDFTRMDDLKRHVNKHYGIRPHQCLLCGSSYAVKSGYRKHLRVHPGSLRFKCTHCGVGFDSRCELVQHVKNAHSKSTDKFQCSKCSFTCKERRTFKRHGAQKHPEL